jgi:Mlc titration factor MtfA (ptsG expression regulator)
VLGGEYERLQRASRLGRSTVLDEYGATDPAEFFAVATESFFEKPHVLRKRHPELYEELKSFYRQDPARLVVADHRENTTNPKNSDCAAQDSGKIPEDDLPP